MRWNAQRGETSPESVTSRLSRGTLKEIGQRPAMSAGLPSGVVPRVGADLFASRCERPPFIPSIQLRFVRPELPRLVASGDGRSTDPAEH